MKILKNFFFWISLQKDLVPHMLTCSVTAKMFELRNSGKNRRKKSETFLEYLPWAMGIYGFDLGKKKLKIISCLCTFKDIDKCKFYSAYCTVLTHRFIPCIPLPETIGRKEKLSKS